MEFVKFINLPETIIKNEFTKYLRITFIRMYTLGDYFIMTTYDNISLDHFLTLIH